MSDINNAIRNRFRKYLDPKSAEKIIDPAREVKITPTKDVVKSDSWFCFGAW